MNFLFITTNLSGGGAEKAIINIASLMHDFGHQTKILMLENKIEHNTPSIITIEALFKKYPPSHSWFSKRTTALQLRKWIHKNNPHYDLAISTLPYADEIARLARLPRHICRIANTLSAEINSLNTISYSKARRRKRRYQSIYKNHPLAAVSNGVATDLQRLLKLNSPPPVIQNPFNLKEIKSLSKQEKNLSLHPHPFIVHVGRFSKQKRHDLLLDTWCLLQDPPDLVLLTTQNTELSEMIKKRGLQDKVYIAGFQANPYPWLAQAQLLVLCSDHEGLPNVLLESLVCGTPVISTDCPSGPSEILQSMPECLVPCGDPHALAETISRSIQTPPNIDQMDFSPYLPEKIAHAWETVAQQALT